MVSSADVKFVWSLVGNTMKVGGVNAASVSVEANGSVSNPTLGSENADIFKFQVVGATDEDVVLKSITFKSDSSDAEEDLANFVLLNNTKEVAATASMNGKYLTFDLGNGLTIGEDKTEKFTVRADVVAWAGDVFGFAVDKKLDVTAEGTKYGYGAAITVSEGTLLGNQITIQAWELTLVDIDAPSDKVREDKDNVTLGTVKVTNVSGGNLELQKFWVLATLTAGTAFVDDGNGGGTAGDGIQNGTEAAVTLSTIFENFELVADNGAAYELDLAGNVYQDTDLNITLPQGTTEFSFRADTKKTIVNFDTASVVFTLDASLNVGKTDDANLTNGSFLVVELEDDKPVSDLTPSSLSWKKVSGTESSATVATVPLSDITKVRGANDVVALQFEVEADESSALTMDEAKVYIEGPLAAAGASSQEISQVTLYRGSVSESNLLDRVSGSNLASWVATFDGFETSIAANAKQTFVVTVGIVDGADAVGAGVNDVKASLYSISVEDDDNDDVDATYNAVLLSSTNPAVSSRDIDVVNFGTLTLSEDANNDDNKDNKTVLAGTSKVIFSVDVQSQNESVDVETVTFAVNQDLRNAAVNASLYLDDTLVATNANSDIAAGTITFKNLTSLIIPQETKELKLAINTATIGFEKVGATVTSLNVTSVTLSDATWVDSGKDVANASDAAIITSKDVAIVPVVITPSVTSSISGGQGKLKITIDTGSNTVDASNSTPSITLTDLVFSQLGNTAEADAYKIYKEGESARSGTITSAWVFNAWTMTAADLTISSNTTYVIVPKGTVDTTYTLNLTKEGIEYTVNGVAGSVWLTSNMATEIELGSKSY